MNISTLVNLLRERALHDPDVAVYRFVEYADDPGERLTYAALDLRARAIAAELQRKGLRGQRALLLYAPGLEYITAFFACLYAGVIAVPVYPPEPARMARMLPRLGAIVRDARPVLALTTADIADLAGELLEEYEDFRGVSLLATDTISTDLADEWHDPQVDSSTLAFLQYTSGSTAAPKGVMLSHANLLHNLELIYQNFQHTPQSHGVIWLPPYHDMGLIGGILQPMYGGFTVTLMPPVAFLRSPLIWLQTITRTRATTSGGPNFAYDLCVRKISPEQRQQLDLSSWTVAFNGAEPIRADTLDRFVEAFAPCGFRRDAFRPCYGLAESTLIVVSGQPATQPVVQYVKASTLAQHHPMPASPNDQDALSLVSSGQVLPGYRVEIVDPATETPCAPGLVGEIWIAGPSVAQGYWEQPEQSAAAFHARLPGIATPFLRSGDLGFFHNDELFVTGRLKDVIIIRGRNLYPQDLELAAEQSHSALRPGCSAAFSVDWAGTERLVLALELERNAQNADVEEVARTVRQAIIQNHEVKVYAVLLLKTGSIPKTSSGKIQRHACREGFLNDDLELVGKSVLDELPTPVAATAPPPPADSFIRKALLVVTENDRLPLIELYLREQIGKLLGTDPSRLDGQQFLGALGLDSLSGIELKTEIERTLGVRLGVATLLSDASIAQLATLIASQFDAAALLPTHSSLAPDAAPNGLALSCGQRALWFMQHLAPEHDFYRIARAVQISGDLDLAALQRAAQRLIDRHAALRTTFALVDGEPVQQIHPQMSLAYHVVAAADWSETELLQQIDAELHRSFDLSQGPLLRLMLFARGPQDHVLIFAVHHLVVDFWSLAVIIAELQTLYVAERNATSAALPPLDLSYTAFVAWQTRLLAGPEGERLWNYWQRQLADVSLRVNLPADYSPPAQPSYRGAIHSFALPPILSQRLQALARQEQTSLYALMMAAWQVLLYRLSGQTEIVVGTPLAARSQPELKRAVGYFVNPVAIRGTLEANLPFRSFLTHINRAILEAIDHQDYPFSVLIARLHPVRDAQQGATFNVVFNWQKAPAFADTALTAFALDQAGAQLMFGPHRAALLVPERQHAEFDLELTMAETADGLAGTLKYSVDRFAAPSIERLLSYFLTLLEGVVAHPSEAVATLPILPAAEQQQILHEWNDQQSYTPACIHQLFAQHAVATPDAIAITGDGLQLSYAALDRRSSQIAQSLLASGVQPGQTVALMLENGVPQVEVLLAILKSGAAFVCLDTTAPALRLEQILSETQAKLLIVAAAELAQHRQTLQHVHQSIGLRVLLLGGAAALPAAEWWQPLDSLAASATLPVPVVEPDSVAYVAYTSGSTGKPKGVVHTHASFCQFIEWQQRSFAIAGATRMAQLALATFDVSYCEIFGALCFGATLCVPRPELRRDPRAFNAWLTREGVTLLQVVPSFFRQALQAAESSPAALHPCTTLEQLMFVGEALPVELVQTLRSRFPQRPRLFNVYGPTEAVAATWYPISNAPLAQATVPVGRAIDGRQILILDAAQQLCPIGVKGEIYIRSAYLAQGYIQQPAETAKVFIQNPLHNNYPDRVYRTGDLARWLPDGTIDYCGRSDHQVKVRGVRIELEEIEAVLRLHTGVAECAAAVATFAEGDQRLIAYVVLAQTVAVAELREWLRSRLPAQMLPSAFVVLTSLPRLPNGKINRAALPHPDGQELLRDSERVAPRNALETRLSAIWQGLLRVDDIGVYDNFFDLGGHSLLIVQMVNTIQQEYAIEVPLRSFWEEPTIAHLAVVIEQERAVQQGQRATIARLKAMVQHLSDEDVQRLLQERNMA